PPYENNAIIAMNRQLIDNYLESDINFFEEIDFKNQAPLPTMLQPPSSRLPLIFSKFYLIQGRIYLSQFRNKVKNGQIKPLEDLLHSIDQFRTNLYINPDS